MTKQIVLDKEARKKLKAGIDKLANAVRVTLGPKGRNVVIADKGKNPIITKDGVTVAKSVVLEDEIENAGAQLIRQVASQTGDNVGDGTSSSTVLAQAMIESGLALVEKGLSPIKLKRGIDIATKFVIDSLEKKAIKINTKEDLSRVATISANNEKDIGDLIAEAFDKVGSDGAIHVEESKTGETKVRITDGYNFNRGFVSPYFITNPEKREVVFENPLILFYDDKINNIKQIFHYLDFSLKNNRPIVLIAEDFDQDVLATLVLNKVQGNLRVCAVKAPAFAEHRKNILEDLALMTSGKAVLNELEMSLEKSDVSVMGTCKVFNSSKDSTTFIFHRGNEEILANRVEELKNIKKNLSDPQEIKKIDDRISRLAGCVAVIEVGGSTEVEIKEKLDRIDDSIHATRAALESGVVDGGGLALLSLTDPTLVTMANLEKDVFAGCDIVRSCLKIPFMRILKNAGKTDDEIRDIHSKIVESEYTLGFNANTDTLENLSEAGVIDPAKVTISAIRNAASVAGLVLTTECVIFEENENTKSKNGIESQMINSAKEMM